MSQNNSPHTVLPRIWQDKGRPAEPFLVAAFPKILEDSATVAPFMPRRARLPDRPNSEWEFQCTYCTEPCRLRTTSPRT